MTQIDTTDLEKANSDERHPIFGIKKEDSIMSFKPVRDIESIFVNFLKNDELTPPLVAALRNKNDSVTLNILVLTNSLRKLLIKDFNFYYTVTFDAIGLYRLQVYIVYNKDRSNDKKKVVEKLDRFQFQVTFSKNELRETKKSKFPGKIQSVKVFLVNTNPKTSRGTTTTVQSGG